MRGITTPPFTRHSVPFSIGGSILQTECPVFGDIKSRRPLLVLHGGPGCSSDYMEPFAQLSALYQIPVILYDQLGCGDSLPTDSSTRERLDKITSGPHPWSINLFEDELQNVINHLAIARDFDLLGLKNLMLANSLSSIKSWMKASWELVLSDATFPRDKKNALLFVESHPDAVKLMSEEEWQKLVSDDITAESPIYGESGMLFLNRFVIRMHPWPPGWVKTFQGVGSTPVTLVMCGTLTITFTGSLREWDITKNIHKIKTRTLIYNSRYERAQDFVIAPFFNQLEKVKWFYFEGSGHLPHYDDHKRCMKVIGDFLLS